MKTTLRIPFSRLDLVLGTGGMSNEALQAFTHIVRYVFCKQVWQARNIRVFEQKLVFAEFSLICQDIVQMVIGIGAKQQQAVEWTEVLAGII